MQHHRPRLVHATAVALPMDEGWAGVLLRGAPGAGKSDLALRLIDEGARLIADDQTELCLTGTTLTLRAPARIAGLMEVRGLGLVSMDTVDHASLVLVADLVAAAEIERLPAPRRVMLAGIRVAALHLAPFEASATAKLRLAARTAQAGMTSDFEKLAAS